MGIHSAVFDPRAARWSEEERVVTREQIRRQWGRHVRKLGNAVPVLDALQMASAPRLPSAQIPADPRLAAVQLVRTLVARFAWVAPSFSVVLTATTPVIWGW